LACSLKNNDIQKVRKSLSDITYTNDEVSRISYLIEFLSLDVGNAYRLKKRFDDSKLLTSELLEFASINEMDYRLVKTFVEYSPAITGHILIDEGFSGKGIGDEMNRRETREFLYQLNGV